MAWLVLVYIAADNSLAEPPQPGAAPWADVALNDLLATVVPADVTICIQVTRTPSSAELSPGFDPTHKGPPPPIITRYTLVSGTTTGPELVPTPPKDTPMSVPLTQFITWALGVPPPVTNPQVALVMFSHGNGVGTTSAQPDVTHGGAVRRELSGPGHPVLGVQVRPKPGQLDIGYSNYYGAALTIPDLAGAIAASDARKTVDVLAFDACSMAQIELLYELRAVTSFVVASEVTVPNPGFPYATWLGDVTGDDTPSQFAIKGAEAFWGVHPDPKTTNMTVLQGGGGDDAAAPVNVLTQSISALAAILVQNIANGGVAKVQQGAYGLSPFLDILDIANRFIGEPALAGVDGLAAASQAVIAALAPIMVYPPFNPLQPIPPVAGLAIVFPYNGTLYSSYSRLQFAATSWYPFLVEYLKTQPPPEVRTRVR